LAAWLFYLTNVVLLIVALRISGHLVHRADQSAPRSTAPLVLALLCSGVFVLDNLNHGQINLLILVLCLLGIQAFALGREVAAGGWRMGAAAIKLTPAFFLLWARVRGSRRTILAIIGFGVCCLALPMAQRGWEQGVADLSAYYQGFLQKFAAGHVITDERNQNLTAMIYRAAVPEQGGYAYLPGLTAAAPVINRALAATILAVLLIHLVKLRIARQPVTLLEIAAVFLASHLLSGITWKAHLVSLLFVSYAFFSREWRPLNGGRRTLLGAAWVGLAAIGLGRDLLGSRLHHALAGYSVYVWVMLLLFTLSIVWSGKEKRKRALQQRER
jgi:hypothetical protein